MAGRGQANVVALAATLVFIGLAGCQNPAVAPGRPGCDAASYLHLRGLEESALEFFRLPAGSRIHRAGAAPGADHVPARLNIVLDEDDVVTAVRCG